MANGFEELDAKLVLLDEALDDPDLSGSPSEFLFTVKRLTDEIATCGVNLTQEDFEAEYVLEDEASDKGEEQE